MDNNKRLQEIETITKRLEFLSQSLKKKKRFKIPSPSVAIVRLGFILIMIPLIVLLINWLQNQ